jgi:hypothetical protein
MSFLRESVAPSSQNPIVIDWPIILIHFELASWLIDQNITEISEKTFQSLLQKTENQTMNRTALVNNVSWNLPEIGAKKNSNEGSMADKIILEAEIR